MRILPLRSYLPTIHGLFHNFVNSTSVFPFYASFKLTSRCHFGCPYCNVKKQPVQDLSTEDIKKILDNLSRSPVLMTSFEGGEPLLRDDIGELLRYARSCQFYLLFTTSVKNLLDYPLDEYCRYIDFLHISIDEGHDNCEMFEILPQLSRLPSQVSVQTVVTRDTVDALDSKVEMCCKSGSNIVVIPATHMDDAKDCFPDIDMLEKKMKKLRKQFPSTIHTPSGYFDAYRRRKCSSGSVIIAPDGSLYYPCHILGHKGVDLRTTDLTTWLRTKSARQFRSMMKKCGRNCGWYQYYAIDSYTTAASVWDALQPIFVKKQDSIKR